ncbi:MAG TPA: recombinase family protein [Spirochaetia bacterium]|nr:recombinase family protein [Spirochaetia bacterium]
MPTPGQYFKSKHPDKKKFSNMSEKISWETVMVYNILKNLVYTGTLVSRKMKSCGVGSKKRVVNEPIIVEGTHEAIISKEDFELVQKVIRGGGRNPTRKQHDYPLKGLVRCGNCKRAMTRRKNKAGIRYFQCIHSVNNGNTDCPVGRSFPEMDIEKVVFHALTQFLALAQKEAIQNREVGDLRKSAIKECADKIRTLQKQNEQHKASKLRLYEKYAAGSITKEAYIQQKATADVKIAENDGVIQRSHERMKELDSETACSDEKLDAVCEQYADCKALTHELTHTFISAVYIYDLDNIEIVWKFKDFLTTSEGEAK